MDYKKQWNLISFYHKNYLESKFKKMSQKGYHYDGESKFFSKYMIGEPKNKEYHIQFATEKRVQDQLIKTYIQADWEYITSHRDTFVFAKENAEDVPLIAPRQELTTIEELIKKEISSLFIQLAILLIYLIPVIIFKSSENRIFDFDFITNFALIFLPLFLFSIIHTLLEWRALDKLKVQLMGGEKANCNVWLQKISTIALLISYAFSSLFLLHMFNFLDEEKKYFKEIYPIFHLDEYVKIEANTGILTPQHINYYTSDATQSINLTILEARTNRLANKIAIDTIKSNSLNKEFLLEGFDQVLYKGSKGKITVFMKQDNNILIVDYRGKEIELDKLVDNLKEVITILN